MMRIQNQKLKAQDAKYKAQGRLCLIYCVLWLVSLCSLGTAEIDNAELQPLPAPSTWEKWMDMQVVAIAYRCSGDFAREEVSKATVIQVGDAYSRTAIRKSIENIYSLGGFSNVEADAQALQNGVSLTFILTKKMKTGNISFVKSLFSIGLEYRIDLDNKNITKGLQREFEANNISLSQDAAVSTKEKGRSWLIKKDASRTYLVRGDSDRLEVYQEGPEKLKSEEIIQVIRLEKGREYDDSIAKMDVESIRKLYQSRGYFDVDISFLPSVSEQPGQVDVIFNISAEKKSIIREIIFIGTNEAVTRTEKLFDIDLEFQSDLDNGNISAKLVQEFKSKKISLPDKAAVSIEEPGFRWLITNVTQVYSIRKEGERLDIYRTKSLLEAMVKIKLGAVYEGQQALDSDLKLVEGMHRKSGYITAKIREEKATVIPYSKAIEEYKGKGTHFAAGGIRTPASYDGEVAVVIEIEQGRKVYVRIQGNRHIKDRIIEKAIAVQRMYSISESVLKKSDEDIEKLYKAKGYYTAKAEHEVLRDKVWRFDTDGNSEGWEPMDKSTSLDVSDRSLKILSTDSIPQIESPEIKLDSNLYYTIQIRMRTSQGSVGRLYWISNKSDKWDERKSVDFDLLSGNRFHDYRIDVLNNSSWSGTITGLIFAPVDVPGADIDISSIKVITESITVVFQVTENQLMRVGEISIVTLGGGKPELGKKDIGKQMLTRKRNLLSYVGLGKFVADGIFDEIVFETDLRAIIAFYKHKGYPAAQIAGKYIDTKNGKIDINIVISEGPKALISKIVLETDLEDFPYNREVLSNLAMLHGFDKQNLVIEMSQPPLARYETDASAIFREGDIVEGRSYLRTRYADAGYLYVQIEPQFNVDSTEAVIVYRVKTGEKVRIDDEIDIRGNNRTKRRVIERELSDRLTKVGIFSYTEISKSWQRLLDLGIFESVRIDTEPVSESGDLVKLIVEVKERKAISTNMSVGFSSSEDFRAGIQATHSNLWGTSQKLGGKAQIGIEGTLGKLNYTRPRLFGTPALGLAELYRYSEKDYKDYPETRIGGTVGIRQRLHRINTLTYGYRFDHVKYEDEEMNERTTDIGRIETIFQRDGRDSMLNPKKGWSNILTLEYASNRLGGSETFAKFTLNSSYHFPLSQNVVLALGAKTGYAQELGGEERVLTPEQFDMSDYTIPRGYKWQAKDGGGTIIGNFLLNTSIELRFPIYKWMGGAIFFDSGYVYDRFSDFDVRPMKSAVGLGLRFTTPIGPARLDYGYPVRGDGNRNHWPHIAIGQAF